MAWNNNQSFSTKDQDNDASSLDCAVHRRSGWWHNGCTDANLNGQYYRTKQRKQNLPSIYWWHWKRSYESLKRVEMKIKLK